jgi:hypothetical protein
MSIAYYDKHKEAIQQWQENSDWANELENELWELTGLDVESDDDCEKMAELLKNPPDKYKPLFVEHYRREAD